MRGRLPAAGVVALGLVAWGCSRSRAPTAASTASASAKAVAPPSASAPPTPPPLAKGDVVSLMEALARVHAEHAKDCARLASELEAFEQSRGDELSRATAPAYAAIEADPPLAERLGRAMETVMTASMACANEPRFAALHARRQGKPALAPPAASSRP